MKNRAILTMILATTIISGLITGCGASKDTTAKAAPTVSADKNSATETDKKGKDVVTINVSADNGWDADSTPAILHIDAKDTDVDFFHAITPDAEGGKGTTTVTLAQGTYTVEFVSPLNHDGSAYEIFDMGDAQDITVEFGKDMTVDCEMKQIPADQVTDEMIQDIVKATQNAIEKGDDTLKGDAGKATLDKLAENVQNSPNASDDTKDMANVVKKETEVQPEEPKAEDKTENKQANDNNGAQENNTSQNNQTQAPVENNNNVQTQAPANNNNNQNTQAPAQNNNQNNNNTAVQPTTPPAATTPSAPVENKPQAPAHTHTWADHVVTNQVWVPNVVTVPDYEEQTTYVWVCNCGAVVPSAEYSSHSLNHLLAGEPDNGHDEARTTQVQVGSHTEDQGHYETQTSVDYVYCTGCGARQ